MSRNRLNRNWFTKNMNIMKNYRSQHRTARYFTAVIVAVIVVSFFSARTHLAWAGKDTSRVTSNRGNTVHEAAKTTGIVGGKMTAASLATSLVRSAAYVTKSIKAADKKLVNPKEKRQKPFFGALKKANDSVKELSTILKAKDDKKLFKAMDRTGRQVNELDTAYRLSGIKDPSTADGIKKLVSAFKLFRKNFGKEALRKKKGGPLAPKETEQAKALQDKYRKSLADLTKVRDKESKSTANGSKASLAQLNKLVNELNALLNPPAAKPVAGAPAGAPGAFVYTLGYYDRMLAYEDDFTGSWYALSSYESIIDPSGFATYGYGAFSTSVADINSFVSTTESSFEFTSAEYWSYTETTTVETTESYDVSITESEISQSSSYLESLDIEVSVDEYDVTVGNEDSAFIDHDDDGIIDSKDDDDDGDGTPDAKDLDDDGDGIADIAEEDSDHDGTPDAIDDDDDNDGIDDDTDKDDDGDGTSDDKEAKDNDNDGIADDKDTDDDNDGTPDAKDTDDDGDGTDDAEDTDDDNDGVDDSEDADHDNDGDGTPDAEDKDDDNDGTPDEADTDDDGDGESDAQEAEEEAEPEEEPAEEEPAEEEPAEEEPADEEPAEEESGDEDPGAAGAVSLYKNDRTPLVKVLATWTSTSSTTSVEFRSTTDVSSDGKAVTTTTAYLKTTPTSTSGESRTRKISMTGATA